MTRFLLFVAVCVSLVSPTAPRPLLLHTSYAFRLLGLKDPGGAPSSKPAVTTASGPTTRGPGTVSRSSNVTGIEIIGSTNPADVGIIGSTTPADVGIIGSTNPADVGIIGSTNPADVEIIGSTNPTDVGIIGSANPADVGIIGSTNPADVGIIGSNNSADVGIIGSNNPTDNNLVGSGPEISAFVDVSNRANGLASNSKSSQTYEGMITENSLRSSSKQGLKPGGQTGKYPVIPSGQYAEFGTGTGYGAQSQGHMEMILPENFQAGPGGMITEASLGASSMQGLNPRGKNGKYPDIPSGQYAEFGAGTGYGAQSQGHMEMILPENFQAGPGGMITEASLGPSSMQGLNPRDKTGKYPDIPSGQYAEFGAGTGYGAQSQGHMEMILPENFQVGPGGMITEASLRSSSKQGLKQGGKTGPNGSTKTGKYPDIPSGQYAEFGTETGYGAQSQGHMEMILPENFQAGPGGMITEASLRSSAKQGLKQGGKTGPNGSTKTGKYPDIPSGQYAEFGAGTGYGAQSQGHMEMILPENFQVGPGGMITEASLGSSAKQGLKPGGKTGPNGSTKTGKYPDIPSGQYAEFGAGTGYGAQSQGHMEMILPENFQVGPGGMITEASLRSSAKQGLKPGGKSGPNGSTKTGLYPDIPSGQYAEFGAGTGHGAQSQGHMEMILPENFGPGGMITEASLRPSAKQGLKPGGKTGPNGSTKTGKYPDIPSGQYAEFGAGTGYGAQSQGHMEMILPENFQAGPGGMITETSLGSSAKQGLKSGGKTGPNGSTKTGLYPDIPSGQYAEFGAGTGYGAQSQGHMEMILPENFQAGPGGMIAENSLGSSAKQGLKPGGKTGPNGSTKTGKYPDIPSGQYAEFGAGTGYSAQSQGHMEMILPENFGPGGMITEASLRPSAKQGLKPGGKTGPNGSTKTGKYPDIPSGQYAEFGAGTGYGAQSQGHMEMILPENFQAGPGGMITETSLGSSAKQGLKSGGKTGPNGSTKTGKYPDIPSGQYAEFGAGTGYGAQSQGHMEMILPENFQAGPGGMIAENSLGSSAKQGLKPGGKTGPNGSTKTGKYPDIPSGQYAEFGAGTGYSAQSQGHMEMILPENFGPAGMITEASLRPSAKQGLKPGGKTGPNGSTKTGQYPNIPSGQYAEFGAGTGYGAQSQGHMEMILPENFQVGPGGMITEASLRSSAKQGLKQGGKTGPNGSTKTGKYPDIPSGQYAEFGAGTGYAAQSQGHMEMILPENFQVGPGGMITEASLRPSAKQGLKPGGKTGPNGSTKTGQYPNIPSGQYAEFGAGTGYDAQSQGHMEMILPENFQVGPGGMITEASLGSSAKQGLKPGGKTGPNGSTKTGKYPDIPSGQYAEFGAGTGYGAQSQGHMEMILPENFQVGPGGMITEASLGSSAKQGLKPGGKTGPNGSTKTGKLSHIISGKNSNLETGYSSTMSGVQHGSGNGMMYVGSAGSNDRVGTQYQDAGQGMMFIRGANGRHSSGTRSGSQQGIGNGMYVGTSNGGTTPGQLRPGMLLRPSQALPQGGVVTFVDGGDVTVRSQGQEQTYEIADLMPNHQ